MDKFWNLMYDFFAFSLPGTIILVALSVCLDEVEHQSLILQYQDSDNPFYLFIIVIVVGYLVGYIVSPIVEKIMLKWVLPLHKTYCKWLKPKENADCEKLMMDLEDDNWSYKFVQIRDLFPRNSQYIEFWDMHKKMSHNLALAFLIIFFTQLIKLLTNHEYQIVSMGLVITIISPIAALILIRLSIKYWLWWHHDIQNAYRLSLNIRRKW